MSKKVKFQSIFFILGLVSIHAGAQEVIEVTRLNDYSKFPVLSKLCIDQHIMGGRGLSLGTVVVTPMEIFELNLSCGVDISNPKDPVTNLEIVPSRTLIKGAMTYKTEEKIRDVQMKISKVKGVPEVTIAVSGESTSTAVRYLLKLNKNGQPINERDHYEGTMDPSDMASDGESSSLYNSGLYSLQSKEDTAVFCAITEDCDSGGQRQIAVAIGSRMWASLTLALGWLSSKYPTNSDLDRPDGRVDFQASLAELQKLIKTRYRSSEETEKLLKDVKEQLARVN